MRIVLDTNVLARATPGKQGPAAALRAAIRVPHMLVSSPYIFTELAEVLRYARLRKLHGLSDSEIDQFVAALHENAVMVNVPLEARPAIVPQDPEDDPVVRTAVIGNAEYLCSLDKHLNHPQVKSYFARHGVRVVTDIELLELIRGPQQVQ